VTGRPLDELLADAPGIRVRRRVGTAAPVVTGITIDSRAVRAGDLFCCVPGERADGHEFAATAVAAGAVALLVDHEVDVAVPQVVVDDVRATVGPVAAAASHHPSRRLAVVGVTGTNGKTTTTNLLARVLEADGRPCGVIGTLTGTRTTPEAPELQARLADFVADGRTAVAMEVSSHALALHRVDGTRFRVAVFTNLSQDHLDLHGTMERYFAAKARLFDPSLSDEGVVCVDGPYGELLADGAGIPVTRFSLADATDVELVPTRVTFRWAGQRVQLGMGGRFNIANALAAATAARRLDVPAATIAEALSSAPSVPGRFEPVDAGQPFAVVVDYAHTPDGLGAVLAAARESVPGGRVLLVFGCGGDRDAAKRPAMGRIAAEGADTVVVTSDNPRREDPAAIISAVLSGIPPATRARVVTEPDRRAAIGLALAEAAPGDVVLVAGKGHEPYQEIGDERLPFDDRAVARALLEAAR
jgi:UDP-N-acetylmuramoyl-L-alanyl-D-glutamate--2,6-diaminopimelate ligase